MDLTGDIAQLVPAQLNVAESGDSNDLGRIKDVDGRSYQGISNGHDRIPLPFDQLPGDPFTDLGEHWMACGDRPGIFAVTRGRLVGDPGCPDVPGLHEVVSRLSCRAA
jgi:hypothetical protein